MPNAYESAAREKKVGAMLAVICDLIRITPGVTNAIAAMPRTWFVNVATAAGVSPPSDATIAAVIERLREIEYAEVAA